MTYPNYGFQPSTDFSGMQGWGQPAPAASPFNMDPLQPGQALSANAYGFAPNVDFGMAAKTSPSWFSNLPEWMQGAIGTKEQPGWGGMALGAGSALMNGWMGMQQYGLAKDALGENKRQFQMNYDAQKTTTNSQLRDRQTARVASNPGAYQSVGDYMNQNGVR